MGKPVLHDEAGRSKVVGKKNGVLAKVIQASCSSFPFFFQCVFVAMTESILS